MATEIRQFTASIPAGTLAAAPLVVPMRFPARRVDGVEIIVPPGSSGLVGFALLNGTTQVIPYQSDSWIITAAEKIEWPIEGFVTSGDWSLRGYNTGTQAHSVYVRFLCSPIGTQAPVSYLLREADLSGTVDTTTGVDQAAP